MQAIVYACFKTSETVDKVGLPYKTLYEIFELALFYVELRSMNNIG